MNHIIKYIQLDFGFGFSVYYSYSSSKVVTKLQYRGCHDNDRSDRFFELHTICSLS